MEAAGSSEILATTYDTIWWHSRNRGRGWKTFNPVRRCLLSYLPVCLCAYLPICDSTVLLLDLGLFFSFLIPYTVGRTPWTGNQPVARPLLTHRTTQTKNKLTQTSMPRVGFEPMIPTFERGRQRVHCDRLSWGPSYTNSHFLAEVHETAIKHIHN
jgi:hypothetical protein